MFDGPTSDTRLDEPGKFPGMEDSPIKYVSDLFNIDQQVEALSQANGYAIRVRAGDWTSAVCTSVQREGSQDMDLGC